MSNVDSKAKFTVPLKHSGQEGFLVIKNEPKNQQYMEARLALSGLTPDECGARPAVKCDDSYSMMYYIQYNDMHGNALLTTTGEPAYCRTRGELTAQGIARKLGKYYQRSSDGFQESNYPFFHERWQEVLNSQPEGQRILAITEGEIKTISVMKYADFGCIGIPGCAAWHRKGEHTKLHPLITDAIKLANPDRVIVIPDGDVMRPDIGRAYGGLMAALEKEGVAATLFLMPTINGITGVDEHIVRHWQDQNIRETILDLPLVGEFMEDPRRLVQDFHLVAEPQSQRARDNQDPPRIMANEGNLGLLVEGYQAFSGIWFNEDESCLYVDEDTAYNDYDTTYLLRLCQRQLAIPRARPQALAAVVEQVAYQQRSRSPWREYLRGVEWDGVNRLDTWLLDYCYAHDTPMAREGGLKWMVGAVGRTMDPGCKMDYMMVLVSEKQGIGKSGLPDTLFQYGNVIAMGEHLGANARDATEPLAGCQCANYEEMSTMIDERKGREHLKALISGSVDDMRLAYAHHRTKRPRTCALFGSTNDPEYLRIDKSGHRRYVNVYVDPPSDGHGGWEKFKFVELEAVVDQLWAEAVHLYDSGTVDFSMVEAARHQGAEFVGSHPEYDPMLDAVTQDYNMCAAQQMFKAENQTGLFKGQVKEKGGESYYFFVLGEIRKAHEVRPPKSAKIFNESLELEGWLKCKGKERVQGKPRSGVWGCPVRLLTD